MYPDELLLERKWSSTHMNLEAMHTTLNECSIVSLEVLDQLLLSHLEVLLEGHHQLLAHPTTTQ